MMKIAAPAILLILLLAVGFLPALSQEEEAAPPPTLLTDPFLQLPTEDGVHVVWFTEFEGSGHSVTYGADLDQTAEATTMKMSRLAEDQSSRIAGQEDGSGTRYERYTPRDIWRHEAHISGLETGVRVPYFVTSIADDGTEITSEAFSLQPLPAPGQPLKILLTSDHQLMPMTATNLQLVEQVAGGPLDAVILAGDLQNIPDRASEWFDDSRGGAFFPLLQGNGNYTLTRSSERNGMQYDITSTWQGGELIQHAPLFPTVGNHEVMGRFNPANPLNTQYNDPHPRAVAEQRYELYADVVNPNDDPAIRELWIQNNSWNTITYEELFTLPQGPEGERYYAMQFGDVYLISLFITRIASGATVYQELEENLNSPENWNYGQVLFGTITPDTAQYEWLVEQLESEAFQNARYKIVQVHHPTHSLGGRVIPAFTEPRQVVEYDEDGNIEMIRYEYPKDDNHLVRYLEPLLEEAGVDLVLNGHTHIWNRFVSEAGINFLDSSNVGNTYRANWQENIRRRLPPSDAWTETYDAFGDPYGLEPVFPTVAELRDEDNAIEGAVPYLSSNDITAFSLLDTETGTISSYYYDLRDPEAGPVLFDEFTLNAE